MLKCLLVAISALITSCASPKYCGESFCIKSLNSAVSKRTPVEDFNLYSLTYRDKEFLIYEGNNPKSYKTATQKIPIDKRFKGAVLYAADRGHVVLISTGISPWPNFLSISSSSADGSELVEFSKLLSPKEGKQK